jgi:phospholipase C
MGMFLEKRFSITVPNISPWHRAVCGDLTSAFDFTRQHGNAKPPELPDTSNYAVLDAQQRAMLGYTVPKTHQPLFQESGMRYSRKLPYELHVNAAVRAGISVELTFSNTGTQGAVYHVYDKLHLDRIPRRYTVEAGKTLTDIWDVSRPTGASTTCGCTDRTASCGYSRMMQQPSETWPARKSGSATTTQREISP